MTDKTAPIMNRGWQVQASYEFLGLPFPRALVHYLKPSIANNKLFTEAQWLFDFQWLLYSSYSQSESHLLAHTGKSIVLMRQSGTNVSGDYEYALPNFQQPKILVEDLIASVNVAPEILAAPEPNLLYVKFSDVDLNDVNSGRINFYDPISRSRLALGLPQFKAYIADFNSFIARFIEELLASDEAQDLGSEAKATFTRNYISKSMLTAVLFAPLDLDFEFILRVALDYREQGFERIWQFFTDEARSLVSA